MNMPSPDEIAKLLEANAVFTVLGPVFRSSLSKGLDNCASQSLSSLAGRYYMKLQGQSEEEILQDGVEYLFPGSHNMRQTSAFVERTQDSFRESAFFQGAVPLVNSHILLDQVSFNSGSSAFLFGCIFFNSHMLQSDLPTIEIALIHEMAHHELYLLNLLGPLIQPEYADSLLYSPQRNQFRPPKGRLHAAHALYRMTEFCRIKQYDTSMLRHKLQFSLSNIREHELTHTANRLCKIYESVL